MEKARKYKDLIVWQKSHEFVLLVYKVTENFPKTETFGLTSQFRRAAVSVAANIAEGFVKRGKADKLRFYNISQGSLDECSYYIILASDLKYINETESNALHSINDEVNKLLNNFIRAIQANST